MSKLAQAGEREHVNDHRQAYEISLKAVERVLKTHVDGKRFGPQPTQQAVENLVRETIKKQLHPRLRKDMHIHRANWRSAYSELMGKSKQRDDKRWHELQGSNRRRKSFGEVTYNLTTTSTTAICETAPADLIKY